MTSPLRKRIWSLGAWQRGGKKRRCLRHILHHPYAAAEVARVNSRRGVLLGRLEFSKSVCILVGLPRHTSTTHAHRVLGDGRLGDRRCRNNLLGRLQSTPSISSTCCFVLCGNIYVEQLPPHVCPGFPHTWGLPATRTPLMAKIKKIPYP